MTEYQKYILTEPLSADEEFVVDHVVLELVKEVDNLLVEELDANLRKAVRGGCPFWPLTDDGGFCGIIANPCPLHGPFIKAGK